MGDEIRVLHIDADADLARRVATFLEANGDRFSVQTSVDPEEALSLLADGEFDCVVSDFDIPGQDGMAFLEAVRAEHPDIPFILFTGKGSEEVASDAISAGVTDYIQKRSGSGLFELLGKRIENAVSQARIARELDRQSELFAKTQDLADVGGWEWDPQTETGFYSKQVYEIYAIDDRSATTPESDIMEFYHPDDRETVREAFETAIETGEAYDIEVRIIDADGVEKWVRTRGQPAFDGDTCVRISGTLQDITDRKEREQELQRQVDRLEEFTGVVSHDLRNPLNVAQGRLDIAQADCNNPHLSDVSDALDRMESIIESTLTLARQGQTVADKESVHLPDVLNQCWSVVETDGSELRIVDEFTVEGDHNRLSQIFENLFRNAVEHSQQPVTIRVGLISVMHTTTRGGTDDSFGFYVEDDGPGIPADRRDSVFDPGVSSRADGTGFGLSIVKRVVEAHGWEVALSESVDGGTRFEFTDVT